MNGPKLGINKKKLLVIRCDPLITRKHLITREIKELFS